jgi:hypothetical protein
VDAQRLALEAVPVTTADDAIAAVRERLLQRGRPALPEWPASKETADSLVRAATEWPGFLIRGQAG